MRWPKCVAWTLCAIIASTQLWNAAWTQENQEPALEYVDSKLCKFCHNKPHEGEQYTIWKSKGHSRAFETLFSKRAQKFADERGIQTPPSKTPECVKCHVTGYDVTTRLHPQQLTMEDGVQCGSCHGRGSAHMADGKILRMNKDADVDVLANLLRPDKNLCITCHNPESPPWNPEKFTLESGEKTGFDFEQALKIISHKNPNKARDD